MIICVSSKKDDAVYQTAVKSHTMYPGVFRSVQWIFHEEIPQLEANEDLVIVAHGGFDVDGTPVIGEKGGLVVDAFTLWTNIAGLFPNDFKGDVFVMSCYGADTGTPGRGEVSIYSFIELLAINVKADRNANCNVFGREGLVRGVVPLPGDIVWIPADIG